MWIAKDLLRCLFVFYEKIHELILLQLAVVCCVTTPALVVDALFIVMGAVIVLVSSLVLLILELSLIITVTDLRAVGTRPLASVGMDGGLRRGGTVLGVIDLAAQTIHAHALLGCHLVGAHLEGDGGVVHWLSGHLLVVDVTTGARG